MKKNITLKSIGVTVERPEIGKAAAETASKGKVMELYLNDRLGRKTRIKCYSTDTVGDLKKLAAAQLGTRAEKIRLQKWNIVYKDHIRLEDYELNDGMSIEMYNY